MDFTNNALIETEARVTPRDRKPSTQINNRQNVDYQSHDESQFAHDMSSHGLPLQVVDRNTRLDYVHHGQYVDPFGPLSSSMNSDAYTYNIPILQGAMATPMLNQFPYGQLQWWEQPQIQSTARQAAHHQYHLQYRNTSSSVLPQQNLSPNGEPVIATNLQAQGLTEANNTSDQFSTYPDYNSQQLDPQRQYASADIALQPALDMVQTQKPNIRHSGNHDHSDISNTRNDSVSGEAHMFTAVPTYWTTQDMIPAVIPSVHYVSNLQIPSSRTPTRAAQHSTVRTELKRAKSAALITTAGPKPRRRGPLDATTRNKVEEMRDMSACWRCRKYKKPCNGPGVCDSCLIPKFKIWPSAIGCRRENLESMVLFLLPVQLEEGLATLPSSFKADPRSWRNIPTEPYKILAESPSLAPEDIWSISKKDLIATCYFGADYLELADIAIRYQKSLPVPHKCLQAACEVLLATCNWYKCVVSVPTASAPPGNIVHCATSVRTITRKAFTLLQHTCLSTKRTDWFPAFLSSLLITIGAVYFMDTIIHIPSPTREIIWHDINNTRNDLRTKTYMLLVDLLRASTKGINPLGLDCWTKPVVGRIRKEDRIKEREREVLLGGDEGALAGLSELKEWQSKYGNVLQEGKMMFKSEASLQASVAPIAGVWKVFEMQ